MGGRLRIGGAWRWGGEAIATYVCSCAVLGMASDLALVGFVDQADAAWRVCQRGGIEEWGGNVRREVTAVALAAARACSGVRAVSGFAIMEST